MKYTIQIESEDLAWLKDELRYQLNLEQTRLSYAHPKSIAQFNRNIERLSGILDALTGDSGR
jgi:hypothetical protein